MKTSSAPAGALPGPLGSPLLQAFVLIFGGCVANNLALEFIVSDKVAYADRRAGPLLTFLQYALVALLTLPAALQAPPAGARGAWRWLPRLRATTVPLRNYLLMAALFALMSFLNNLAFAFRISQPLHMVFRSANLMVTFLFGRLLFGRSYSARQLALVLVITAGAACNTLAEATLGDAAKSRAAGCASGLGGGGGGSGGSCGGAGLGAAPLEIGARTATSAAATALAALPPLSELAIWLGGVAMLTAVLCLQTALSEVQNRATKRYGRAAEENTFYMHALSLPVLLAFMTVSAGVHRAPPGVDGGASLPYPYVSVSLAGVGERLALWSRSPPADDEFARMAAASFAGGAWLAGAAARLSGALLAAVGMARTPALWVFVGANVATQYVCIVGVYKLLERCDPLTVNVVLTVRKAASVAFSIFVFANTFTAWHCLGALLVFGGSLAFLSLPPEAPPASPASAAGPKLPSAAARAKPPAHGPSAASDAAAKADKARKAAKTRGRRGREGSGDLAAAAEADAAGSVDVALPVAAAARRGAAGALRRSTTPTARSRASRRSAASDSVSP